MDDALRMFQLWGAPPYNAEWERLYRAALAQAASGHPPPLQRECGLGFPAAMIQTAEPFEIRMTAERVTFVFGASQARQVPIYGNDAAHDAAPAGRSFDQSIARWEDDTLDVETTSVPATTDGRNPSAIWGWADACRFLPVAVFSPAARFNERLRMIDENRLEEVLTIDDPAALTQPWLLRRTYERTTKAQRWIREE